MPVRSYSSIRSFLVLGALVSSLLSACGRSDAATPSEPTEPEATAVISAIHTTGPLLVPPSGLPIRIVAQGDAPKIRIETSDLFSLEVSAQARSATEIREFVGATRVSEEPTRALVRVGGPSTGCVRDYVNGELKAIRGVCVESVTVRVPERLKDRLFVNGVPASGRGLSYEDLLQGLDELSFDGSGGQKKRLLEAFLSQRRPNERFLSKEQLDGILSRIENEDHRLAIALLLKDHLRQEPRPAPELPRDTLLGTDERDPVTATPTPGEVPEGPRPNFRWIDLRDLVELAPEAMPDAAAILNSMNTEPGRYFPAGYATEDASGIEIQGVSDDGKLTVAALLHNQARKQHFFRKLEITLGGDPRAVEGVRVIEDIPLSQCRFEIRVALVLRKAIVEDKKHGIKKVYPIGVGGFDEGLTTASGGKTRLNTPRFQHATLRRETAYAARSVPAYYRNQPFIPISRSDGMRTPISFHIYQADALQRGFVSHGCMHLRERNLQELYGLLRYGGSDRIGINVNYYVLEREDHPYPMLDDYYTSVANCAKEGERPHSCKDPHYNNELTLIYGYDGIPPIGKLDLLQEEQERFNWEPSR